MALTINNDTAIHEAGHCIISYLATDLFEIKFVTANKNVSKTEDRTSIGGLSGSLKKEVDTLTFEDHDLMVLICLAGMAADDVNHSDCQLTEQLYDNRLFATKMTSNKYSGDCQLFLPHIQRVMPHLSIKQRPYTISCQRLLHEIFSNQVITPILIDLRNQISNSPNQTLVSHEIIAFLDKTELKNWRENEWREILTSRISEIKKKSISDILLKYWRSCWQKIFDSKFKTS